MTGEITENRRVIAQYYELTLHVRLRGGKWTVVVFGPLGLVITHETKYETEAEAQQAAIRLARTNLHEEKNDARPVLEAVDWQPA